MNSFDDKNLWQNNRHHIKTSIGQWLAGDDVIVRGRSLFKDWLKELNYMQLHVLNITGRLIDQRLSRWLDSSLIFASYPDARIWCNQFGAVAATQNTSPVTAYALGCLASDSRAYGSKVQFLCALELQDIHAQREAGRPLADIIESYPKKRKFPVISGFSRPVRVAEERLEPARQLSRDLGYVPGVYLTLAEEISDYLFKNYGLGMNVAAHSSAFLLDQKFSAEEIYHLRVADVVSGVMACYCDHLNKPENSFLPLHCNDINYTGAAKRTLNAHNK